MNENTGQTPNKEGNIKERTKQWIKVSWVIYRKGW